MRYFYYGWFMVLIGALAMIATLPGRTYFLGMISKKLIDDPAFQLTEIQFTELNLWAVIFGAAIALPVGWLIDRFGVRLVLSVTALALAAVTDFMSQLQNQSLLFLVLLLTRGLGQGALSVIALALVGKWFRRRIGLAMGLFSVILTVGFIAATMWFLGAIEQSGWREPWKQVAYGLAGLALLGALFTRNQPADDREQSDVEANRAMLDVPTGVALRSRAFWVFSLCGSLFLLTNSAITLLPEQLLDARGFAAENRKETLELFLGLLTFAGLPANMLGGWLARRVPLGKLMAVSMFALALSLVVFPFVRSTGVLAAYAVLLGVSGGLVTVVYFAAYGANFGRSSLGFIQAFAQVFTVLASAVGPVLLSQCRDKLQSDSWFFFVSGGLALLATIWAWFTRPPTVGK